MRFLSLLLITTITIGQSWSAEFEDRNLVKPTYSEILRVTEFFVSSDTIDDDDVDLLVNSLANLDPKAFSFSRTSRVARLLMTYPGIIEELGLFVEESGGFVKASKIIRKQPELLLYRPVIEKSIIVIANTLVKDSALTLEAANRIGSQDFEQYLPPNLPVSRDPEETRGEAEDSAASVFNAVAGGIAAAGAIVAATTPPPTSVTAAILLVIYAILQQIAHLNEQAQDQLDQVAENMRQDLSNATDARSRTYLRQARNTARQCQRLQNRAQRAACLESGLLLLGNSN